MGSDIRFTPQQQCAIDNRGGSLLVAAAAGSGKTRVLVERVLHRLETEQDCSVTDFLIITYTRAAAAELKERIVDSIARRSAQQPENAFLRRQAVLASKAEIGTIHSFCGNLLRKYSYLTQLPPDFAIIEETGSALLRRQVMEDLLEEKYVHMKQGDSFAALVDGMAAGRDDSKLTEILLETYTKIQSNTDPRGWVRQQKENLFFPEGKDVAETVCGRYLMNQMKSRISFQRKRLEELWQQMETAPDFMAKYGESVQTSLRGVVNLEKALLGRWDDAQKAAADVLWPKAGACKGYDELKNIRTDVKKQLEKVTAMLSLESADVTEDARAVSAMLEGLYDTVLDFDLAYASEKKKKGVADFSDLEHMALSLLVDANGAPTEIAREVSGLYREIMVDEYQDVNRVQDAIFRAVSQNEKNIFMVGDVKQSIYRFRLADPAIFLEKYRTAAPAENAKEGELRKVLLQQNFRSRSGVLSACNFVFRNVMSKSFGEMDYTEAEYLYPGSDAYDKSGEACMELNVIDRKKPEDEEPEGESPDKAEIEATFAAKRILKLMGSFQVTEKKDVLRPIRYGDIAVLLRSPGAVRRTYETVFAKYGIPISTDGGGSFFDSIEISDILALLSVLDNPHRDVELVQVLTSPLFGFTADELAEIRMADGKEDFYDALRLRSQSDSHCREFIQWLQSWRSEAADLTVDVLLRRLYDATGALGLYGSLPGGGKRQENLQTLLQNAVSFAEGGSRSLFGFVHSIGEMMDLGKEPILPAETGGGDAVSFMSIHKSKGLEFPVVLLTGLSGKINETDSNRPLLIHSRLGVGPKRVDRKHMITFDTMPRMAVAEAIRDETKAEELRILSVAMTRAKEKLICVMSFADAEKELTKLMGKIGSLPISPGCLMDTKRMGDWILLPALCRKEADCLRFGAAPPALWGEEDGTWEIRLVTEQDGEPLPVLEKKQEAKTAEIDFSMLTYEYPYTDRSVTPSKITATELKGRYADGEAGEEAERLTKKTPVFRRADFAAEREMTGAERGTALHLVMQYIRFEKCRSLASVREEIQRLAEKKIISQKQAEAVDPEKILQFFRSPLGRAMEASGRVCREMKFSVLVPSELLRYPAGDEIMLQGVVDCYFETEEGLTVLDFKTDYVNENTLQERAESYAPQLEAYGYALERMTGKPIFRKVLYFFSIGQSVDL